MKMIFRGGLVIFIYISVACMIAACGGDGGTPDVAPNSGTSQNIPPTASISLPASATYQTGESILFSGFGMDADGTISSYSWDFGDGAKSSGAGNVQDIYHSYTNGGVKSVSLMVTDDDGDSNNVTVTIYIAEDSGTTPINAPTKLSATAIPDSQISLLWTPSLTSTDVAGYNIYRDSSWLNYTTSTAYTDTGLSVGTQYCYTVTAYDAADNESEESNIACATLYDAGSNSFNLPDTGQTASYTETYGEDSDYSINPMSFTYSDGGIITDNVTGLMWNQSDTSKYNWYEATGTPHETYNPGGSVDVCGSLSLGGYSDWRVPSMKELITIVDYGTHIPAIDTTYFMNTVGHSWTSTTYSDNPNMAWYVDFMWGIVATRDYPTGQDSYKYWLKYVRCIRGEQAGAETYSDNGDGTVTDNIHGLVWQRDGAAVNAWEEALTYCEGLNLGGHNDWRLPNIKELNSIIDVSRMNPAINTTYFVTNMQNSLYWSSTSSTYHIARPRAWQVTFSSGRTDSAVKSGGSVRCVRSGH